MSYQLIKIPLQNVARKITYDNPLYLNMGPLTGSDSISLFVSVVVGAVSGGFTSATLSLEQSPDAGLTWAAVPSTVSSSITGIGTTSIGLSGASGILLPNVRLKVAIDTLGDELYIADIYRTLSQSSTISRPVSIVGQLATENTSLDILAAVDGLETEAVSTNSKLDTLNAKDFATSAKQDTLAGKIDTLNAKDFATSAKQDTLAGKIDTLNAKDFATAANQTSTNSKLDTLNAKDFATSAKQDILAGKIDTLNAKDFATSAKQDTLAGKIDTLNAKDFATETTLQKLRNWPYASYAYIEPTSDVNNEYYTYKTALNVTVGTITIAKVSGIITYSPVQGV